MSQRSRGSSRAPHLIVRLPVRMSNPTPNSFLCRKVFARPARLSTRPQTPAADEVSGHRCQKRRDGVQGGEGEIMEAVLGMPMVQKSKSAWILGGTISIIAAATLAG